MLTFPRLLPLLAALLAALAFSAASAHAAPLPGSAFDTGDGDQLDVLAQDWQAAAAQGRVKISADANDDCFRGGVKELAPAQWAFDTSLGGCTPGKSNLRVAYVNPESTAGTTFSHFAFFRNDTTGNTFLTFELNQLGTSWTNPTGTTIPCRTNGDILLSFEVGGSSLKTILYRWQGTSGGTGCASGATGTFVSSGEIPGTRFQGTMNAAAAISNFVAPTPFGATFPRNAFGEAAIDLPGVLKDMGQSPCFGFLRMQVHSRSSSSISSAMIDYTTPVPIRLQSCAITGTTYKDENSSGSRDAGEPGLAGFTAYADLDGDGELDAGEPRGESDAEGFYRILDVPAGTYSIRQVRQAGWRCSDPSPCLRTASLITGGNSGGNDFGYLGPSTAAGTVFHDVDASGTEDDGEPGLDGARVFADYDHDAVLDDDEPRATTAGGGAWMLSDLAAGTYELRVEQGPFACSLPDPCARTATFASGSSTSGLRFGAWAPATVGGTLFEDLDADGAAREAGEPALAGWQVYADLDRDGSFTLGEPAATTNAAGDYALTGIKPGTRDVRVTPIAAAVWHCIRPGVAASACLHTVPLTSGATAGGKDFGFARFGTVSGTSFNDTSKNGVKDGSEGWLAGPTMYADYDGDNTLDAGEPTGEANASGAWTLTGVRAGTHTIRQLPYGAYKCTAPGTTCSASAAVVSGGTVSGIAFGNYQDRVVSGTVFNDLDADGTIGEAGEPGVAGVTVWVEVTKNGVYDPASDLAAVTNSVGAYTINATTAPNGSQDIIAAVPAGWTCSSPGAGCRITGFNLNGSAGSMITGANFGLYDKPAITGVVHEDADADGATRESGEALLAGRRVYVDANASGGYDAGEPTSVTDGAGAYAITGLNPGTYTVRQVLPAGWTCSRPVSPCAYTVTTSTAGSGAHRDFASHTTGTIAGTVREDLGADGAVDGDDAGLAGRTLWLDTTANGVRDGDEPTATTGTGGSYTFTGVAPGGYTVRQVVPAGWTQSAPAGAHTATVLSGGAVTGRDFLTWTTGAVAGRVFDDADFAGDAYDADADGPVAGVPVYADLDGSGAKDDGEPSATTDASGLYAISGIRPGTTTVRPVLPAGRACASPAPCAQPATVTSRGTAPGRDFGTYAGATIAGTIFEDADADGAAREAGETGADGVRVWLDTGDGVRQASEPTAVTDASGAYTFRGVVARSWQIRLDLANGWSCDRPVPCRESLTATSGSTHPGHDFGVHRAGTISGHLFTDRDNDGGPQVFGENDQPQRTLWLDTTADGVKGADEPTAVTDDAGNYTFTGVEPGTYAVRQVLPTGWVCRTPQPCVREGIVVTSGAAITGQDFSSWTTAKLSGTYFEDHDGDGEFVEEGEVGIAGREVYLDANEDGDRDGGEPARTTAAGGTYSFTGLAPGTYVVRSAEQPGDWTCSYPKTTCAVEVTVEAAEHAQDLDFGAWTTGTVRGTVWNDVDSSGTREGGDAGVAGRTVFADANGNGRLDAATETAATTQADGAYELVLDPGAYVIHQVLPSGWTCTAPAGCTHAVTVDSNGTITDRDFGAGQVTGIAGTVFADADGDGAQDAGESGIAGATVWLDTTADGARDDGEPVRTTDAGGAYRFTGIAGGAYDVRVAPGARTCLAPQCRRAVTIAGGEFATGTDFALVEPATVSGTVFEDVDADGAAREAGEPAASGRTVWLDRDRDGDEDAGETVTTGADGGYAFTGVLPGTYPLRALDAAGWTCSVPATCARTVTVTSGTDATGRDFGAWREASLTGTVLRDRDADGTRDGDDDPRSGVGVFVDYDRDGEQGPGEPGTTTGDDGGFALPEVRPGTWPVVLRPGSGWTCSAPADCAVEQTFTSGAPRTLADALTWQTATVAGAVYDDADGDGSAPEAGDAKLAATVWLDRDRDGERDAAEETTSDAATGAYAFGELAPGTYDVRVTLPGRVCSAPAGCLRTVTVASGDERTGQDFGGYAHVTIAGTLTEDGDADGTADAGEQPLGDVWTYLDTTPNGVRDDGEPAVRTGADGRFAFTGLAPGTYRVRPLLPAGYECSAPAGCERTATLASGAGATGADVLAFRRAAVSGTVTDDLDADGAAEAGEPPLAGRTVFLDTSGDGEQNGGEPATTTGADGRYAFTGLRPGAYAVKVARSGEWVCSAPAGCGHALTLASGETPAGRDFALFRGGRLAGRIAEDADGDGTIAAAEPGLAGATVYADLDGDGAEGAGEPSATTAGDGAYALAVAPGARTVRVRWPAGFTCSAPTPCAVTRTVASGQDVDGLELAAWAPAKVAGRVLDTGGAGVGGVQVFADTDADGAPDAGEPTVTTDGAGAYALGDLRLGAVTVRPVIAAPRTCTAPAGCRREVRLTSRRTVDGQDFTTALPAKAAAPRAVAPPRATTLAGALFEDDDADGAAHEEGEPMLRGWTVYVDANENRSADAGEPSTTTDAAGRYAFGGLAAGRHVVRFVPPSPKWVCSLPADCARVVTLGADGQVEGQDFAAWRKAKIEGVKFEDADRDGSDLEAGDARLAGWRIYVDVNRNGRRDAGEPTNVTDGTGRYGITNVPFGEQQVREVPPPGSAYRCTFPADSCLSVVTVRSSGSAAKADFGAVRGIPKAQHSARVTAPTTCQPAAFRVRVGAGLARRVELRVDGRRRAVRSRSAHGRYAFRLDARRYGRGVHRVSVRVTFLDGSRRTLRATFYRCAAARPQFTG